MKKTWAKKVKRFKILTIRRRLHTAATRGLHHTARGFHFCTPQSPQLAVPHHFCKALNCPHGRTLGAKSLSPALGKLFTAKLQIGSSK